MERCKLVLAILIVLSLALPADLRADDESGLVTLAEVGNWMVLGGKGYCAVFTAVGAGQFGLGVGSNGTVMTFQDLRWSFPGISREEPVMPTTVYLDAKQAFRTEAIVLIRAWAFQIFLREALTLEQERSFWKNLLRSQQLVAEGLFKPGRVEVTVAGVSATLPELAKCASLYLSGQALPFEIQ